MFTRRNLLRVAGAKMLIGALAILVLVLLYTTPGPLTEPRQVVLPKGSSTREIATILAREGAVSFEELFYIYAAWGYLNGQRMKAGEYRFHAGASPREIFLMLWEGRTVIRRLTIPEGFSVAAIRQRVTEAEGLEGTFPANVEEGSLLPETYRYSWGDSREGIAERMRDGMQKALAELWPKRASDLPFATQKEALTLASIVERETGVDTEREMVAAVYANRLRQGMKLQADPTVIYGFAGGDPARERPPTLSDLKTPTPYNTYTIDGLPPGPIANPGRRSIEAALHPAHTDALYFVADGRGGHRFAATFEEHLRNVALYRKAQTASTPNGEKQKETD